MATFAAIKTGTGASLVSFDPAGYSQGSAVYENRKSGIPVGYETINVRSTKNVNVRRTRYVLTIPKLQTSTAAAADGFAPAPRAQFSDRVTVEFVCSNLSGVTDRQLLLDRLKMILADDSVKAVVVTQEEL